MVDSKEPEDISTRCLYYDSFAPRYCWMGKYGQLKCCSERKDCSDYKTRPTEVEICNGDKER